MKFKVGDKVKLIKKTNCTCGFNEGEIYTITQIDCTGIYRIEIKKNSGNKGYVDEEHIKKVNFTKSDLKDGDIVTYKDNHKAVVLEKQTRLRSVNKAGLMYFDDYDEELNYKTGGHKGTINDIIKVERPTQYETVFERKEEILDKEEKRYLKDVIRPFRNKISYIEKSYNRETDGCYIFIALKCSSISLPPFEKDTMYKGMKPGKQYTLEELRIIGE